MSQNIYLLESVQNRSKGLPNEPLRQFRPQTRIREKLASKLKDGILSLSDISRKAGISRGYLSMFLNGYDVGPKILRKLRLYLGMAKHPRNNRRVRRIFPSPGTWHKDAI